MLNAKGKKYRMPSFYLPRLYLNRFADIAVRGYTHTSSYKGWTAVEITQYQMFESVDSIEYSFPVNIGPTGWSMIYVLGSQNPVDTKKALEFILYL